jgi:isopentenyl-diphosphate delta-isomerase
MSEKSESDDIVTPWFRLICERFLFEWWENLDDLHLFKDTVIHSFI